MGEGTKLGTCPLCRRAGRELQRSHLLPRQATIRAWNRNLDKPQPRILTEGGIRRTANQIRQRLLCADCEKQLNRNGESYALGISFFEPGRFPLQDLLAQQQPITADSRNRVYAGAEIEELEVDKLAHYGAGIFWKATAAEWYSYGNPEPVHIALGPYEDGLRRFVHDHTAFPQTMVLTLCVSPAPEHPWPLAAPPRRIRPGMPECHHYALHVLGLKYELFVGAQVPDALRRHCLINSPERVVSMSAEMEDNARRVYDPRRKVKRPPRRAWTKVPKARLTG